MLQLENETGLEAAIFASPDPAGIDTLYAVVKGTFDLTRGLALAEEQVPIALAAEHYGDPATTSMRTAPDISLVKPGTDVLVRGTAYAPGGRPTTWMDVRLRLGALDKTVRVFGDRYWRWQGVGYVATEPEPFEAMPLVWERAFGGTDSIGEELSAESRNPVGTGYHASGGSKPVEGERLPNLEDPRAPLVSWKERPPPACFAPIAAHWEPRRSYAGTYDEKWQQSRAPYLPEDFDSRFFNVAPPDQVFGGYLFGGEPVELTGFTREGVLRFALPALGVRVTYFVGGSSEVRPANLDTVLIEPDESRVVLVWRAALRCDKKLLRVEKVRVDLERAG